MRMDRMIVMALAGAMSAGLVLQGASAAEGGLPAEAGEAVARAEARVEQAKTQGALWTTAADALERARAAAKQRDSATAIQEAVRAEALAALGLAQRESPLTGQ